VAACGAMWLVRLKGGPPADHGWPASQRTDLPIGAVSGPGHQGGRAPVEAKAALRSDDQEEVGVATMQGRL